METLTAHDAEDLMSFLADAQAAALHRSRLNSTHRPIAKAPVVWTDPIVANYALHPPQAQASPLDAVVAAALAKARQRANKRTLRAKNRIIPDAMKNLTGTPALDALPTALRRDPVRLRRFIHEQLRLNMIRRGVTPPGCTLVEVWKSGRWRDKVVPVRDVLEGEPALVG